MRFLSFLLTLVTCWLFSFLYNSLIWGFPDLGNRNSCCFESGEFTVLMLWDGEQIFRLLALNLWFLQLHSFRCQFIGDIKFLALLDSAFRPDFSLLVLVGVRIWFHRLFINRVLVFLTFSILSIIKLRQSASDDSDVSLSVWNTII